MPLLLIVAAYFLQPANRMRELRNASRGADGVRIVLYVPNSLEQRVVAIPGAEKVQDFLDQIQLQPTVLSCRCQGMTEVQFARGDEVVVRLNFAGEKLLWKRGKWRSDGFLTSASSECIRAWIEEHGGAELQAKREEVRGLWEAWRANMDESDVESRPASAPASSITLD